jgi:pyruvate formate lyase activating enzyme
MKEALFYHREGSITICDLCPRRCRLEKGETGLCLARFNQDGVMYSGSFANLTSVALDPIEKKPLYHYFPGSKILSIGSYGCNLCCPFCQNHYISREIAETKHFETQTLVRLARETRGNLGVAFTYNEPIISIEYILEVAAQLKEEGLKTVLVTNGYINDDPLHSLLDVADAMNIDLKGFRGEWYSALGGSLETVKNTIRIANAKCHVEVTCLIVPGENDSVAEMEQLSTWLAQVSIHIPLFITRFYPRYKMRDRAETSRETVVKLSEVAKANLLNVYAI